MEELYTLGRFDKDGNFVRFIRKGRNNAVVAYDNLSSAKRGLAQSKIYLNNDTVPKIIKANSLEIVEV